MNDSLLDSLARAVQASPDDTELRLFYAQRLAEADRRDDALGQALVVLSQSPDHAEAKALAARMHGADPDQGEADENGAENEGGAQGQAGDEPDRSSSEAAASNGESPTLDWDRLEDEIRKSSSPEFDVQGDENGEVGVALTEDTSAPVEVSFDEVTLDEVAGLTSVKDRIQEAFLDPLAHPEIARAFNKVAGGGLLLYGPPGCGKTFIARAIAGELGARFMSVTVADILSKWLGESEHAIHATFLEARQHAPSVLFFDEIDSLGGKRSGGVATQAMRSIVNQLLMELDGVGSDNEGVFVLAATNMPWEVDSALLRPGRFDRTVLVEPPDEDARAAILRMNLAERPQFDIDFGRIVRQTALYSGADLKHVCDTAVDKAMAQSISSGRVEPVTTAHMLAAIKEVKQSIGPWLDSAANVVSFANQGGRYDDLATYLKSIKRG